MFKMVQSFISEYKNINENMISMGSSLTLDLGLTSFDIIEVSAYLEDILQVEISDEIIPDLYSVGDLVVYLESICNRKS